MKYEGYEILCKLKKSNIPLTSKVNLNEFTKSLENTFDYDFDGISKFYPFEFPEQLKNKDYNIIVITGKSGSGKSTFMNYYGSEEKLEWDNNESILSQISDNINDASFRLNSTGLGDLNTWVKPRHVLSIGEGFRADLARKIKDNCVIDEYTSTIDRHVAISASKSLGKYIIKNNIKNVVLVSAHNDYIPYLLPNIIIDTDEEQVYELKKESAPKLKSIYIKSTKLDGIYIKSITI